MFLRIVTIFKAVRAFIFAICMLLSIGCATILSIFLLRQWNDFDLISRIIVIVLTVVHSLGAILLYLMIIVQFKVWLDAARVSIFLVFVLCGALLMTLGRAKLPCSSSGIEDSCTQSTLFVVLSSFVISGLLIIYSVALAVIAHTIPRPLLAKAPSDIDEEGLIRVNSRTQLIPPIEKSEARDFNTDAAYPQMDFSRRGHGLERHAPRPLILANPSEHTAQTPVFHYTVTSSPTTNSSLSTPMSSTIGYKPTPLTQHPYAVAEPFYGRIDSPLPSAYFSRPTTPLRRDALSPSPTPDFLRVGYRERLGSNGDSLTSNQPSQVSRSMNGRPGTAHDVHLTMGRLGRSESAQSAPPSLGAPRIRNSLDRPLPNPFQDPPSRITTPSTSSIVSSGTHVPTGTPTVSLSFGSRGFPLPPSYNATLWSQYTNDYLKLHTPTYQAQTPPSTPLSLRPGVHVHSKRISRPVVVPHRPLSFGSLAASLHSAQLPSPPQPAARLLPHPRLQAHLESVSSQDTPATRSRGFVVAMGSASTTPTSAKTSRSQFLPTDIPDWLASEHRG
ncbi:hypothetical protein C8R42DRAFT_428526 [Lentinula raphanica]|nr:hypothetical protein C8R42DRAFT_428526 [Lentinula raphanica]